MTAELRHQSDPGQLWSCKQYTVGYLSVLVQGMGWRA